MLRGLCARLAGTDLHLRDDLFQDGVLAVLKALERFDPEKGLAEHFAARSARGCILNSCRSRRSRWRETSAGSFAEPDDDDSGGASGLSLQIVALEAGAEHPAFNEIDFRTVTKLAATILTANEFRAVELVYFEERQTKETAVQMGVSAPRITQLVQSALAKLRRALAASLARN
jgi:RNA polymerase sigma factor (sigma-70 family)